MMNAYMKMSNEELMLAVGGRHGKKGLCEGPIRTVHGLQSGWLALRSEPRYDYRNEIGQLYNGDFDKTEYTGYTWVYSKRLNMSGWVNSRFI